MSAIGLILLIPQLPIAIEAVISAQNMNILLVLKSKT
jgi:hypothetical protein